MTRVKNQARSIKDRLSGLAPVARKSRIDEFTAGLEPAISKVEKLERSGKKAEAEKAAERLQPVLDALSAFSQLSDTLDEIEVKKRAKAKFLPHSKRAVREWKPLGKAEDLIASKLLAMSWKELLECLKKENIALLGISNGHSKMAGQLFPRKGITAEVFQGLQKPSGEDFACDGESYILVNGSKYAERDTFPSPGYWRSILGYGG